jgi:alanine dehydrogenase
MTCIAIPKETKIGEARVGLTPREVAALVADGHDVMVQSDAGVLVGITDNDYVAAGARITRDAAEIFASDLIAKVKEIQSNEFALLQKGSVICGFAQVARDPVMLDALLGAGVSIVAYEAICEADGSLPVLAPMSRIAGTMCASVAQWCMHSAQGGRGVLLGPTTHVAIVGAGNAGFAAAEVCRRFCKPGVQE